jgi:hypothetical protein
MSANIGEINSIAGNPFLCPLNNKNYDFEPQINLPSTEIRMCCSNLYKKITGNIAGAQGYRVEC